MTTEDSKLRKQMRTIIYGRRADIDYYLDQTRPRRNLLTNISIVCTALAALFTAAPATTGTQGMKAVAATIGASGPAAVWQPLCIAAFVAALAGTITVNLNRSYDLQARVIAAESCRAGLDSLLTTLDFDELSVHDAVERYQKYLEQIPFVPPRPSVAPVAHRPGRAPNPGGEMKG